MRARRWVWLVAAGVTVLAWGWPAGAARADIVTPPGKCVATARFAKGASNGPFEVSSQTLQPSDVVKVPLADTVTWTGEITGAVASPRTVSGEVSIDLPWPFGTVQLGSWSGEATKTANNGVDTYDLPSATPRGVELQVHGVHRENGSVVCTGTVSVEIDGSPFSSPATFVSLGGLAFSGVALLAAGRAKYRSVV